MKKPLTERFTFLGKLVNTISIISLIWTYITVGFFIYFGKTVMQADLTAMAIIIFVISGLYLITNTIVTIAGLSHKSVKKAQKPLKVGFGYFAKLLKLTYLVIVVLSLISGTALSAVFIKVLPKVLSIIWIVFQILMDITIFFIKLIFKGVKNKIAKGIKNLKEDKKSED